MMVYEIGSIAFGIFGVIFIFISITSKICYIVIKLN